MSDTNDLNILIHGKPFIDDEDVIGKWEHVDIVQSEEQFNVNQGRSVIGNKGFKEIYFLPNGQPYWIFEGWTKGYLFTDDGDDGPIVCNAYKIKEIDGKRFMFLEVPADTANGEGAYINVLEKTSDKRFVRLEIGVHDNIDLPFIMDETVLGLWTSVDFVTNIGDFNANKKNSQLPLWLKSIRFNSDGTAVRKYADETWHGFWTKGVFINKKNVTASAYTIRLINSREYLFVEWKQGDYVFGGFKPKYYVFERSSNSAAS